MPTVAGQSYMVLFYLATQAGFGRDGTCEILVDAGGAPQTYAVTNMSTTVDWTSQTFTFTATSSNTVLRFRCLQDANLHFAVVDGVRIGLPTGGAGGFVPGCSP